jgi:Skp family chaperone for outer membrane proteins
LILQSNENGVRSRSKGNEALTAEVARLMEQLRKVASELKAALAALNEKEKQSQKLAGELAGMAEKLKRAQEEADNAKSVAAVAQKQLQESEDKVRELESALGTSLFKVAAETARAERLEVVIVCVLYMQTRWGGTGG